MVLAGTGGRTGRLLAAAGMLGDERGMLLVLLVLLAGGDEVESSLFFDVNKE